MHKLKHKHSTIFGLKNQKSRMGAFSSKRFYRTVFSPNSYSENFTLKFSPLPITVSPYQLEPFLALRLNRHQHSAPPPSANSSLPTGRDGQMGFLNLHPPPRGLGNLSRARRFRMVGRHFINHHDATPTGADPRSAYVCMFGYSLTSSFG